MRTSSLRCVLALPCPRIWMVQIVVYAKPCVVPAITVCADALGAAWSAHELLQRLRIRWLWRQRRLKSGLVHGASLGDVFGPNKPLATIDLA